MNFPPILRFLYRSFQVHLSVVFVVSNFVYICHIPTEQLFVWYIFKTVKHVVYQYNKFTDLYVIGEKKRRKIKWLETNLSQWLSKIYRNLLSTWSYYHKWYRLSTSACTYSSMTPPSHFNVPSEQHMVNFVSVLLWSSLSLCMSS